MDEAFYGTLPQDTQDFTQILRGVKRNLTDAARGVSYYPYDLIGAPVDIINMALTPIRLGSQQPVLGSDYLRNIAKSLGLAQDPTGSIAETTARIGAGFINPATGARAVGQIPQQVTRGANITADKLVQMITKNPEATAARVIDETQMPFLNAVAPKAPSLLQPQKSDLGFYSQLEAATIPLQNKGTGAQFLAQIEKTAGVKPEEVKWTGLDEFLKSRQNVTKAEIQDYLNANRVDLKEFRLAGDGGQSPVFAEYFPDTQKFHVFSNDLRLQGLYDTAEEADAFVKQYNASIPYGPSKFSKYTLPGGENYREILLTLPQKQPEIKPVDTSKWNVVTVQQSPISGARQVQVRDEQGRLVGQRFGFHGSDQNAIQEVLPGRLEREADLAFQQQNFRSSHFDQPNILAHMRVNDRVVDGKNTLFIEEIQSDWHQAGRKKGYATGEFDRKATSVTRQPGYWEVRDQNGDFVTNVMDHDLANASEETVLRVANQRIQQNDPTRMAASKRVPDAPFKTSWHELALKRAIQEASEKGYDQIAFTTGKTQAERYDLSKQIKTIVYGQPDDSGRRTVRAITPNGDQLLGGKYTMSEIEDNIGKEMAEKIQKSTGEFDQRTGTYAMSGLDLQVGGEGMKGFYDNILPKSLDKLGKKFGAKVGKTEMDGVEVWTMPITPEMRQSVTTKGQPLFAIPAIGTGLLGSQVMQEDQY